MCIIDHISFMCWSTVSSFASTTSKRFSNASNVSNISELRNSNPKNEVCNCISIDTVPDIGSDVMCVDEWMVYDDPFVHIKYYARLIYARLSKIQIYSSSNYLYCLIHVSDRVNYNIWLMTAAKGSSPKYCLKSLSDWLIISTAGFWLATRESPL